MIETIDLEKKNVVWINCQGTGSEAKNQCAIYVERTPEARSVSVGDKIWWQGSWAFWTPRSLDGPMPFEDKKIPRWGYSGVSRPE